ncbi:MAG: hypothetical protein K0S51_1506 [Bacillales bacterium]|jgi:hypothetical protein|nr:hypothetical protein [Bacillales bacterium]
MVSKKFFKGVTKLFVKKVEKPLKISGLEALLRRISANHPSREKIIEDLSMCRAGFYGEQSLEYFLNQLPQNEFRIFHNLRFETPTIFQIDFFLLSKKFILILEVKNMVGKLEFDEGFGQLIQIKSSGETKIYNDPVLQASGHKLNLEKMLLSSNLNFPPITYLVVMTKQNSLITVKSQNQNYIKKIIRSNKLLNKITELSLQHSKELITEKELKKITKFLLKSNQEREQNLLEDYGIEQSDLIMGVICDQCSKTPMKRICGRWLCLNCKFISYDSHLSTLNDYILLIENKITNNSFRRLTRIESSYTSNRLLKKMGLNSEGDKRHRVYHLPPRGFGMGGDKND